MQTARDVIAEVVTATHRMTDMSAGDGYTEPREHWVQCSCGMTVWAWQEFYAENDTDPDDAKADHLADAILAALESVLAAHERQVRAEALREAADAIDRADYDNGDWVLGHLRDAEWLRDRADDIEGAEG